MKHYLFTCAFILFATMLLAQNSSSDEVAIKEIIKQQEAAWNKQDWENFSSYFTDDATLINPVGQFWKGRNDIVEHFKLLSDCCLSPVSLRFEFKNARFITTDIAIVYIEGTAIANKDYDVPFHQYKKGETDYTMMTNIYTRQNNEWKITAAQVTSIN